MTTVLAWTNVVALLGVGGLFLLFALIPFAMANDDPRCGPLVRYGFLQLTALGGIGASLLVGAWVASGAADHDGWTAVGVGAAGWGVWIGGLVLTMAGFFGVAALDMAVAERRRRRRTTTLD
ncbi:hypothetical protein LQ327_15710 [Actinomycetospora endophytica]|uniref:Integral membrane protein n=1 Tax=Actinomycetospora endophytica TaxID=2291215 RepID=A0ABS8P9X2_9PSEU|nr:hypothetical protein [Actinomycetospora endophytica]MCD2194818.1 hypothetical protein [Actinomycetospora endophytica]